MDIPAVQATLRRFAAELLGFADRTSIELGASPGVKTHVLIDWENVQPSDVDVRALVPDATDLWLFHGPNQKNVAAYHASFGDRATPVRIARTGKNALDFHLTFYIGYIASRQPEARFVVISNDKGYGPMLEHAKELGFAADQVGFVRVKGSAAKKSAASRTRAGTGAAAKSAKKARKPATAPARTAAGGASTAGPADVGLAPTATPARRSAATKTARKPSTKESTAARGVPAASVVGAGPTATPAPRTRSATSQRTTAGKTAAKAAKSSAVPSTAERTARRSEATKKAAAAAPSNAAASPSRRRKLVAPELESPSRVDPERVANARTGKSFEQVLALLGKRPVDRLPHKQARLLADIAQMIGAAADSAEAQTMLNRLVASGRVSIDERRTVRYAL